MKRLNIKRVFFGILFLVATIYGILQINNYFMSRNFSKGSGNVSTSIKKDENVVNRSYPVIKEDINRNYSGKRTRKS